ncbi:MAG: hypothetical protein DSY76_07145, partial [Bacteroidetes bacterium]
KEYFYFSFIPVMFVTIMLLSNRLKDEFFVKVNKYAQLLLYFLFLVTLFEFITNIHLPVHTPNRFHIPSAFFTNANDLSVIVIQLFFLISVLYKKTDSKWTYRIAFLITTFIVFLTLSRLALIAYILVSLSVIFSKRYNWKDFLINTIVIGASLVYLSIDLPTPQSSSTVIDRSKTRINSMTEFDLEELESNSKASNDFPMKSDDTIISSSPNLDSNNKNIVDYPIKKEDTVVSSTHSPESNINNSRFHVEGTDTVVSSTYVRLDIYKTPFRHPEIFIFGHGFNSDKKIIIKYKTLPHHIINSHSFFIQSIFYFGWIGFGIILIFFGSITIYAFRNFNQMRYFIPVILAQALLLNIPSSVMRFPLVWIPFFITIAFYIQSNKMRRQSILKK